MLHRWKVLLWKYLLRWITTIVLSTCVNWWNYRRLLHKMLRKIILTMYLLGNLIIWNILKLGWKLLRRHKYIWLRKKRLLILLRRYYNLRELRLNLYWWYICLWLHYLRLHLWYHLRSFTHLQNRFTFLRFFSFLNIININYICLLFIFSILHQTF